MSVATEASLLTNVARGDPVRTEQRLPIIKNNKRRLEAKSCGDAIAKRTMTNPTKILLWRSPRSTFLLHRGSLLYPREPGGTAAVQILGQGAWPNMSSLLRDPFLRPNPAPKNAFVFHINKRTDTKSGAKKGHTPQQLLAL